MHWLSFYLRCESGTYIYIEECNEVHLLCEQIITIALFLHIGNIFLMYLRQSASANPITSTQQSRYAIVLDKLFEENRQTVS